nr:unnamed protein product [Callosobruchus analis]
MTEKNIEELELYAKEELKSIVPQKDYVKYYGSTYKNYPEKFKFVIGHKKMLHLLIEFCKSQENSANEENKENIRDTVVYGPVNLIGNGPFKLNGEEELKIKKDYRQAKQLLGL